MRNFIINQASQKVEDSKDFFQNVSLLIWDRLNDLMKGESLDRTNCIRIYTVIFNALQEVMSKSKVEFSNESLNYLSQQFYDGILINGTQELDPNIFTQRAKLENIQTGELVLMSMMLKGTDFVIPIIQEVKHRS
jgi:hypothetical protein